MSTRGAALYLQIPAAYCRSFGGLRWAQYGDAVEFLDGVDAGRTFAFAAEIARFIQGLHGPGRSTLAFGFVLHLLYMIGLGDRAQAHGSAQGLERIAGPFREEGRPLRNAGALCAWLCRDVPGLADPPDLAEAVELLMAGSWVPLIVLSHPMLGAMEQAEQPGLEPAQFEGILAQAAEELSDEEIRHWLKHGRGPLGCSAERLVPLRRRGLAQALADVERRPRLAGVARLVSRLEGALCLPPRRLAESELPSGGYADVTTRGSPEQILPIQFALDNEEFLRRFAQRELLYFHREEPHRPATEELVILLDQGVRTWGDIRLVLAGAALALARQTDRRRITIRLTTTSSDGEFVDPGAIDPRELASLLERSDLSPHPGRALANLLQALNPGHRDVVLLTHPLSLRQPAVITAARSLADDQHQNARLFAVSVDSGGQVELAELHRGWPVVVRRCRIRFDEETSATSKAPQAAPGQARTAWKGGVEPIPFPFRCGTLDRIDSPQTDGRRHLDFDDAGSRILVVGRYGLLFAWRVDGTDSEVLPRALGYGQTVMRPVKTVLGVAGGFVLVNYRQGRHRLAHYDFPTRTCTIHTLDDPRASAAWMYLRDQHTVVAITASGSPGAAVDLAAASSSTLRTSRAIEAASRIQREQGSNPTQWPLTRPKPSDPDWDSSYPLLTIDRRTGSLRYLWKPDQVCSITPMTDGRPALCEGRLVQARRGGDVLALLVEDSTGPSLYFISMPQATVLGIFTMAGQSANSPFALSRDGRRFARLLGDRQLEVRDVPGDRPPVLVTPVETVWIHFVSWGRSCVLVRSFGLDGPRRPECFTLLRWDQGRLESETKNAVVLFQGLGGVVAESRSIERTTPGADYDPHRFAQYLESGGLRVLIDRYNQLAVLDRDGELVCMLYVSRDEAAAWLPDGTTWGSRRLIGGEPTPQGAERIAMVLEAAEKGQRASQ
jgi:hypothetical protein